MLAFGRCGANMVGIYSLQELRHPHLLRHMEKNPFLGHPRRCGSACVLWCVTTHTTLTKITYNRWPACRYINSKSCALFFISNVLRHLVSRICIEAGACTGALRFVKYLLAFKMTSVVVCVVGAREV